MCRRDQQYAASRKLLALAGVSVRQHRFCRPVSLHLSNSPLHPLVALPVEGAEPAGAEAPAGGSVGLANGHAAQLGVGKALTPGLQTATASGPSIGGAGSRDADSSRLEDVQQDAADMQDFLAAAEQAQSQEWQQQQQQRPGQQAQQPGQQPRQGHHAGMDPALAAILLPDGAGAAGTPAAAGGSGGGSTSLGHAKIEEVEEQEDGIVNAASPSPRCYHTPSAQLLVVSP